MTQPPDADPSGPIDPHDLALSHKAVHGRPAIVEIYRALPKLNDWLENTRRYCADPAPEYARAANWLLDNDYHILRASRRVQEDLPPGFYRRLPALKDQECPRVYALAEGLFDGLHPQITLPTLVAFVSSYQQHTDLSNAELWALPSMLRLVCLARLKTAFAALNVNLAPTSALDPVTPAPDLAPKDATDCIARAVTNLIAVHTILWTDFVDEVSQIENTLANDPAGIYANMTLETRDRYRTTVERLARLSAVSEKDVAQRTLDVCRGRVAESPQNHVGFWLIGDGRPQFEAMLQCKLPPSLRLRRFLTAHCGKLYAAALVLGVVVSLVTPLAYLAMQSPSGLQWLLGIAVSFLPATILSVWVVHWAVTKMTNPVTLPELDFAKAIPAEFATAVLVPVLVGSPEDVDHAVEKLELLYLANPDPALRFVVLSDPVDAAEQVLATDADIETALVDQIARLNQRYGSPENSPFYVLHRHRTFNIAEACWMARERKRGKLEDFNRLVTGEDCEAFPITSGPTDQLRTTKYAITLDADTQLPPQSAARLVGVMAHPLNHPVLDPQSHQVIAGHAILQPRIEILPKLGMDTHFSHLYGGDTAVDIYSRAVSDVYQDLFGTGIFVGKGIYDIAVMQRCMGGRVPENSILSHDLFEGLYGRAGLASNLVLYEDLPATYPEFAKRQHRWIRGDWQLVPWLGGRVPSASGDLRPNTLSTLDRWKILDNLRRSLVPPALLSFLIGGWLILPGSGWVWTLLAVAAPGSYMLGEVFAIATAGVRRGMLGNAVHQIKANSGRWFFSIVFLVNDTLIATDAILRTMWRRYVSGKHLLEWTTAAKAAAQSQNLSIRRTAWRMMWPASALAVLLAVSLANAGFSAFWSAAPLLWLWMVAPEISVWSARPRRFRSEVLHPDQHRFLTQIARRTWHFFETFVGPDDHWLPPDNFQHGHKTEIAHRTSPTNIGMFLVSALAAKDMGFITTADFLTRARNAIDTLGHLETHRGHILNWYDTRSLEPLEPRYVSTVDSGNLAVSLIALKQGCMTLADRPAIAGACFGCLDVTLDLLVQAIHTVDGKVPLDRTANAVRSCRRNVNDTPLGWRDVLAELNTQHWPELENAALRAIANAPIGSESEVSDIRTWLERFQHDLHAMDRDINQFMPWLSVVAEASPNEAPFVDRIAQLLHPLLTHTGKVAALELIDAELKSLVSDTARSWLNQLRRSVEQSYARQSALRSDLTELAQRVDKIAYGMDFSFLYDPSVRLFTIGYNHSLGQMDKSHYDLLATEARLASYFAIAKQDAPMEHWFSFTRPITRLQGKPSILSWNGSMFEYLMPPLFLPSYRDTLLGESELTAVDFQRAYARERGVPWGISESAFGVSDAQGTYQYRAFGVPGLGIRRGLTEDVVIAPYGSALALCGWPQAAAENLQELADLGAMTRYGFFDALDFTPDRTETGRDFVPVQTYMAHHQGMIMAAIANATTKDIMVRRFLREERMKAVELLLQERVPWDVALEKGRVDETWERHSAANGPALTPWIPSPDFAVPQVHVLGNGRMSTLVTETGGGGIKCQGQALTRWHADPTRTGHGMWIYLQDADSTDIWSLGAAPVAAGDGTCVFHQHMAELLRHNAGITARMDITVAAYDDVEIRRITLVNETEQARTIDLTSYAEVVLAPAVDDERHPAFSKLFVQSSFLQDQSALLFERRPRTPETHPPILLHKMVTDDPSIALRTWDTDRAHFLGRNQRDQRPSALISGLTETTGWTLDPVLALQVRVHLDPMESKQLTFLTVTGQTRSDVLTTANRYPAIAIDRAFSDSLFEAGRAVQQLDIDPNHLPHLQVLSSLLTHHSHALRQPTEGPSVSGCSQPELWQFGISGDLPILLLKVARVDDQPLLDLLVRAQRLWQRAGLQVDLVVLRDAVSGYEEPLREQILSILRDTRSDSVLGKRGGIHLIASDQISAELCAGIMAAAHVVLCDTHQDLAHVLDQALETRLPPPPFAHGPAPAHDEIPPVSPPANLLFANGYGGFDGKTGDYIVHLGAGTRTPAPWVNVLANEEFGALVSEAGFGTTWATNAGEHRLTPWSNDPVSDTPGEALYLRDEVSGAFWTTTPAPIGQDATVQIRHGAGETQWRQNSHGLEQELVVFVPDDAAVKLVRLRLTNHSGQPRRISATYYAEWLLGAMGSVARPHLDARFDQSLGAIVARNKWNPEFADRVAFLTSSQAPDSVTGDRHDFLGREGSVYNPDGLHRWNLGGSFTAGGDVCAAYQVHLDVADGQTTEVVFALGDAADDADLPAAVQRWKDPKETRRALAKMRSVWAKRLGAAQVHTPDPAFDLMINRWLPYQNRACRIMARAGFYQAGGAFGMRDQLQDVLALLQTDPARARAHILLAAQYQFDQGDALHWWHPPGGRGVRTRCSDDYIWLAFVTAKYVAATGDADILNEPCPFLSAPELRASEQDRYALFDRGETSALYDHCARALDRMMATGAHGLPLIGAGDWNDGMDRIGEQGRGESVWLAWFQIATIGHFAPIAADSGHHADATRWDAHADKLRQAISDHAWDGEWYLRAYDDDGVPWGSKKNEECQIDLIAQAWSVLAGASSDQRAATAIESARAHLVEGDARLVRLLTPPFDQTHRDPGYIRAYPPGIRENGGQYTHAATWLGHAYVALGDGTRAFEVFDLINPIRSADTRQDADVYKREPYVLCGDVARTDEGKSRGGWSWYTGSAGWLWQLGVEGILGIQPDAGAIRLTPCLPSGWNTAQTVLEGEKGRIEILFLRDDDLEADQTKLEVDGQSTRGNLVTYPGKGKTRQVVIKVG